MIKENLKVLRKLTGISQRELGRRIKMSGQYIAKIEKGERTPTIETINKIANALDIDIAELLDRPKFTAEIFFDIIDQKKISYNKMLIDCDLNASDFRDAFFNDSDYRIPSFYTIGKYLGFSNGYLEKRFVMDSEIHQIISEEDYCTYLIDLDEKYDKWVNIDYLKYSLDDALKKIDFNKIKNDLEKKDEQIRAKYAESDTFCLYDIDKYLYSTLINILTFATTSDTLNYGITDFTVYELNELGNFIFNSYKLKVNEILERHKNPELETLAAHDDNLDDETKKKNLKKVEGMFKENKKELTYDDFDTVAAHNDNLTDNEIKEADRRILEDINKKNKHST